MNIEQELNTMITELVSRTGGSPVRIMCNHETLNQLWEQSGMLYTSASDAENNTGYNARFNGIPVIVSPQIDTGKFLLVPDECQTRPIRVEFEDMDRRPTLHFRGSIVEDPASIESGYNEGDIVLSNGTTYIWSGGRFVQPIEAYEPDIPFEPVVTPPPEHWWLRSPTGAERPIVGVDLNRYADGTVASTSSNPTPWFVDTEASDVDRLIDKLMSGRRLLSKRKKDSEEQVEIDEGKFLDILGCGESK